MDNRTSLPDIEDKKDFVQNMFDEIAPTYEKTNRFISFGLDRRSRKRAFKELKLKHDSKVIDLASGTGDFSRMLEAKGHKPFSCDLSFGMLKADFSSLRRIQSDGNHLPFKSNSVDALVCGYGLRNFVDLQETFPEIMRVLKTDGVFCALDVSVPKNIVLRIGYKFWFVKIAPKIGWLISKNRRAYEYLPKSTSYLPDDKILKDYLEKSGAKDIKISKLVLGSLILISCSKARQDD